MQLVKNLFIAVRVVTVISLFNFKLIFAHNCDPHYYNNESSSKSLLTAFQSYGATRWTFLSPTRAELVNEIQFWCIEPNQSQFKRIYVDQISGINIPVAFVVHGYFGSISDSPWMIGMAENWIKYENRAICLVDWRKLAIGSYVIAAQRHTKIVGMYLAEMIRFQSFQIEDTVLVGHSLGAHICGVCGNELNGALKIIYGLDPAGPQFTFPVVISRADRLDETDAQHVQCLHTNRGVLGTLYECGDSDYYPNNGIRQTGCFGSSCSHVRAAHFFEASLKPENIFMATECDISAVTRTCSEKTDRFGIYGAHLPGQFYFETTSCYPFCVNCESK